MDSGDGQGSANEAEGVASDHIARSAGSEALYSVDSATGTERGKLEGCRLLRISLAVRLVGGVP